MTKIKRQTLSSFGNTNHFLSFSSPELCLLPLLGLNREKYHTFALKVQSQLVMPDQGPVATFRRAYIEKVHPQQPRFEVRFIDFGNGERLRPDRIRAIDSALSAVPPQAQVSGNNLYSDCMTSHFSFVLVLFLRLCLDI